MSDDGESVSNGQRSNAGIERGRSEIVGLENEPGRWDSFYRQR